MLPANALVSVLAPNSKCLVVLFANAKGKVLNVGENHVEDNGSGDSDADV